MSIYTLIDGTSLEGSQDPTVDTEALAVFRVFAWGSLFVSLFLLGISLTLLVGAIFATLRGLPSLFGMRRYSGSVSTTAATSGEDFLAIFRFVFVAIWVLVGVMVLLGVFELSGGGLAAILGPDFSDVFRSGIVDTSIAMTAIALSTTGIDPTIQIMIRLVWVILGGIPISCLLLSLGSYARFRHATLRRLTEQAKQQSSADDDVKNLLLGLASKVRMHCPQLAISPDAVPYAQSHSFGFFRKQAFIEVSSRCLDILNNKELEALLAHELSHHVRGDCTTDSLFRYLGRLTFVGDGFVRALEDSFGYEVKADHLAISRFSVDRQALKHCLWVLPRFHGRLS